MIDFASTIEFQISLLLFVSLLGYFIATRFGQSIVIGQILVGIIMGPSVLNLITYTDFIEKLATMGAIWVNPSNAVMGEGRVRPSLRVSPQSSPALSARVTTSRNRS